MSDFNREPAPFYSHLIRGWGGFANIMDDMARDNWVMPEQLLLDFEGLIERLKRVAEHQRTFQR